MTQRPRLQWPELRRIAPRKLGLRLAALAGAVAVLVALSTVLQSRPWGGPSVIAPGIEVVALPPGPLAEDRGTPPGDASGGAAEDATGPAEGGAALAATPVLQIPDLSRTVRALLAQSEGADPGFIYRSAVEARDAAQYALAVDLFDRAAADGGLLAPFAALRAAQMAVIAGDDAPGAPPADRFAAVTAVGGPATRLPDSLRAVALTEGARALEEAGRVDEALAALGQFAMLEVGAFTRAEGLWERARIMEAAGRADWEPLAIDAMAAAPTSAAARSALDLLDERGASYPPLTGAFVAYRGGRNADATTRYEALLAGGGLAADEAHAAWFYLGALRERAFAREPALEAYANAIDAAPGGRLADDARYWRGRVLEELGRPAEAAAEYDLLQTAYPASSFAEDGRLRAAVALGLAGSGAEATARLAAITRTASPATAAEAAHWHNVLVALFDAPPAEIAPAAAYDPMSYAAAFELSGAAVVGPLPAFALAEHPIPVAADRVPIDVWLAAETGIAPAVAVPILREAEVELAWMLAEAGEAGVARGLLTGRVWARHDDVYELVGLAIEAQRRGLHDVALTAASAVLGRFDPTTRLQAPRELLALAYPVPYLDETLAASEEFGVPPLLLYALMRQESAFHPTAGSSAGAFGLTQVIPPTGEAIARDLGMDDWTFGDLARPDVSTRFGAYYLAVQLANFDGHMLAALAAYNGGPGNAARWLEAQPFPGPDGYAYAVDFTETRAYLEHVSSNYAVYRYLYAGTEIPRLPHG